MGRDGVRKGMEGERWLLLEVIIVFNVFMNVFITQFKSLGIGCCISSMYLGCILYADDILLLSTTVYRTC